MSARIPTLATALVFATCLLAPTVLAEQDPRVFVVEEDATHRDDVIHSAAGACLLAPAPRIPVSYTQFAPEHYTSFAWRIPTGSCTACSAPQDLIINSVSFRIRWFTACTAQAEVSIVGATGPPECRVPDPDNVLCGPALYPVSGTGSESVLYTLALPPACCVTGEAFALVRYIGTGACTPGSLGQTPGIGQADAECVTCEQYYTSSPSVPSLSEWCYLTGIRKFWMEVDADCCGVTGLEPRTWGKLKTFYR